MTKPEHNKIMTAPVVAMGLSTKGVSDIAC
jgi:hypothetical protein